MIRFWLLWLGMLLPYLTMAQDKPSGTPYAAEWKRADSLLQRGLPQSAMQIARRVYEQASARGQNVQMLKAQLYMMSGEAAGTEEPLLEAIRYAEAQMRRATFPNDAIWQSIAAGQYRRYYEQYRWQILQRTDLSEAGPDPALWPAAAFFRRIDSLFLASVSRAQELARIDIATYDPILLPGKNTRSYRPTLLELLAFRAMDYFRQDERELTRPAYRFVMEDPALFAPAAEFVRHQFRTEDTAAVQLRALQLFQQMMRLQLDRPTPDALLDAELQRLEFAYQYAVMPDKKERYSRALEQVEARHGSHPLAALAAYRRAALRYEPAPRPDDEANPLIRYPHALEVRQELQRIMARWPGTEGAIQAAALLRHIEAPELALQAEEVVLPAEPSRLLLTYRNLPEVHIRIVPLRGDVFLKAPEAALRDTLLRAKPLRQSRHSLPASGDLQQHRAELMIDALPAGMYAILVSSRPDFASKNNLLQYVVLQASRISMLGRSGQTGGTDGFILDRKTGQPLAGASVELIREEYDSKAKRGVERRSRFVTGLDGSFRLGAKTLFARKQIIRHGTDALYLKEHMSIYRNQDDEEDEPEIKTIYFTDRSIYRPGQTIYFKGIVMETGAGTNRVLNGHSVEVSLRDANYQKVASLNLTSNEFGSISGSFTAPLGLTGIMVIEDDEDGSVNISVEEYKRPRFEVRFDTLRQTLSLNQEVRLQGKAETYAGSPVDGAAVQYRVLRSIRRPWWGWYGPRSMPRGAETVIEQGSATTAADGSFSVSFTTLPVPQAEPDSQLVFVYTVHADITDLNGETRSARQDLNAGYRSLDLVLQAPSTKPDTLLIRSQNLNGIFVASEVRMRIAPLRQPERPLRSRLWPMPDQYVLDSVSFRRHFPLDEYRNESRPEHWAEEAPILEQTFTTTQNGLKALPRNLWKRNGWYRITVSTRDAQGRLVTTHQDVSIRDADLPGTLMTPLQAIAEANTLQPGQTARVDLVSGFKDALLLEEVQAMDGTTQLRQRSLNNNSLNWTYGIREADRGGLAVQWLMVHENRVYSQAQNFSIPWSNKQLSIHWESHRDKLLPGSAETWTLVVDGPGTDKIASELAATLYDASLDAFRPHEWQVGDLFPVLSNHTSWNTAWGFGVFNGLQIVEPERQGMAGYERYYDQIGIGYEGIDYLISNIVTLGIGDAMATAAIRSENAEYEAVAFTPPAIAGKSNALREVVVMQSAPESPQQAPEAPIRKNLQETAFFFPQLRTDAEGRVRLSFTMPEALTEWKLLAVAHGRELQTGLLEGRVKTQKELMVMPGLPRFLRQGDELELTVKISNLSSQPLQGSARLELIDAQTGKPLNLAFGLSNEARAFSAPRGGSGPASWRIRVPRSLYQPVIVRISATAGSFTDGEEVALPVLSNRMLLTETLPLPMRGTGTKTFSFDKLLHADTSKTLSHQGLSVEYTANPAWYAVQALPYLMDYPYECAEQTFNRYYANALAAHIVSKAPRVQAVFKQWETLDTAALTSRLQQNQELKTALLEETPWVLQAQNESEQKRRIALLFEAGKLAASRRATARKLEEMMLPEGAFPWFKGMRPDRYITQYIATGLGRLRQLGVADEGTEDISRRMLRYLDQQIAGDYKKLRERKAKLSDQQISYLQVQYLYMRSLPGFRSEAADKATDSALDYYRQQARTFWPRFNPYMKGMIALAMQRGGDPQTARDILASLRETAIRSGERGVYWLQPGSSYWWYDAPIEAQALLIECFSEIGNEQELVDDMKVWLLKQKQTTNWRTTKATADACHALLLQGTDWLSAEPRVRIQLGQQTISSTEQRSQAGTGYFKVHYPGAAVQPQMGRISVTIDTAAGSGQIPTSWGAVYWQYFEDIDKVSAAASPLSVRRQLFAERMTVRGPVLEPITPQKPLRVGDKVRARIEISTDRDMEYVHLKDSRAALLEPTNVLSGYRWQGGLGYYESTRDASGNFFISYLPRGRYVFEYTMFAAQAGDVSAGLTTIQCMYAPEFMSHSEGQRLVVQPAR